MSAISRNYWDTVSSPGVQFSAGTTSSARSDLTFSNANNVSFGLDALGNVTGSIASTYAGTGFTTATTAGTAVVGTLNTSGLSLGIPAYLTTAAQSGGTSNFAGTGFTTSTTAGTAVVGTLNTAGLSMGVPAYLTTAALSQDSSKYAGTGFTTATTAGTNIVGTLNTSGLSLGVPAYLTTADLSQNSSKYAGTGFTTATTAGTAIVGTLNTSGLSMGVPAYLTTADLSQNSSLYAGTGFTTTTTAGTAIIGTLNTSGLSMGVPAYLTTAEQSRQPLSYFANIPAYLGGATTGFQSNTFYVLPLSIPEKISISYLRMLGFLAYTSTTIATSAVNNATGASTAFSETVQWNAVLYTAGTGANSRSLQYVYSNSAGLTWAVSVSQASTSNASNQSFTQRITYPAEGFITANTSTQYSVSATNGPISTTQWAAVNLDGNRYLDIPFATSLSAGNYWLALNRFTGTVGGIAIDVGSNSHGASQLAGSTGVMGSALNVSLEGPQIGLGSWTTNVAQTTSSIAFASISATSSYFLPYVQFIRQA